MKNIIILPTYNEKENITPLIKEIFLLLPDINIMVVDDNSPDGTADAVKVLMAKFSNLSLLERPIKNGLGGAYIAAFKKLITDNEIKNIIMMDGDFSHNPKYLQRLLDESQNHDLVMGSRYIKGGGVAQWELWRRILSLGGNFYVRFLLGRNIHDWTGGFNCISAEFLKKVDLDNIDLSGYAFIMGLKYALIKAGANAKEIPIIFEARRGGESKLSHHIISEGIIAPWKILFTK
ncbi:MAG: polyprenol monophosphomannose synthase [Candidatus Azambacteria bacterium]|nr:polyprenol monophosphomannose synthase [Candidatus Azambacteria bacterium]